MTELVYRDALVADGLTIKTSITAAETAKLQELAQNRYVLEIGSGYGYSAIQMALAGARHILAIDPHADEVPGSLDAMRHNLAVHDVTDRVSIVIARSEHLLPHLAFMGMTFGLVFIDGNHDEAVEGDVAEGLELLLPHGTMAVHDYGFTNGGTEDAFPEIRRVCDAAIPEPPELIDTLWIAPRPAFG